MINYLDNHILIAEKPRGIPTQPTKGFNESFEEICKEWVKEKFQKKGNVFLTPVHRLDRLVSGLILFARTSKALSRLNAMQRDRLIEKIYVAKVEGRVIPSRGTLTHYLRHGDYCADVSETEKPGFKQAVLDYETTTQKEGYSYLKIHLRTGRYHQIRAQFAAIGRPIVGDKKYGSRIAQEGIDLHHSELIFLHPVTKEKVHVFAKAPFS